MAVAGAADTQATTEGVDDYDTISRVNSGEKFRVNAEISAKLMKHAAAHQKGFHPNVQRLDANTSC